MAVLTTEEAGLHELSSEEKQRSQAGRGRATAVLGLAVLSAAAGAIHFAFAPAHMDESPAHGAFFVSVGLFQIGWALAAVTRRSRVVLGIGVLNAAVVAVWVVSRTAGVPFSETEGAEAPGFGDVAATAFELVIVAGVLVLLARWRPVPMPRVSVLATVVALVAAGATAAAVSPATGGTEHLHAVGAGAEDADAAEAAAAAFLSGDTPCEQSGRPASPEQVTEVDGHSHRGPTPQQPIDAATRDLLAEQQAIARTVVDKFPTVASAEAGGYHKSTPYVPCIGAHYTNTSLVGRFDPAAPSELLFDGTDPDSKLVGLSYLVYHPGGAPEGFAGPNDIWHQHNSNGGLCFNSEGVVIGSESVSEARCAELGGTKRPLPDIWMLHDWVVPGWECSWGVFAPECPELGGRLGGTAWDEPAADEYPEDFTPAGS